MKCTDTEYKTGYREGFIMGSVEAYIYLSKHLMRNNVTDNYEDIIRWFQIPESVSARMMDYLPVTQDSWAIIPDDEWDIRKVELDKRIKEASHPLV